MPEFKDDHHRVEWHIQHEREEDMAKKSEVVCTQFVFYMHVFVCE